jgi:hypothetical protein
LEQDAANASGKVDGPLAEVRKALQGLKFGTVHIIVQDGVVVQIERTEKRRLSKPCERSAAK